jgi:3-hydroxyacyl-CoA dehydrogenase/enoyl-CoA hydratase/3-hydroxybutyryl-CoA epimerase
MAMVMGTGFAPFRGGLLRYADARGLERIRERLEQLAEVYGERFRPASLINQLAQRSGRFHAPAKASNGRTKTS